MKGVVFITTILATLIIFMHSTERIASAASTSLPEKYLEGNELEIYHKVLKNIVAVSEGKKNAEAFYISVSKPFTSKQKYEEAIEKVMFFINNYAPEYLYWNDARGYIVYNTIHCGIIYSVSPTFQERGKIGRAHV